MAGDQLDSDALNPRNSQAGAQPAAASAGPLGQDEVEALLKAAMGGAADPSAQAARPTKADPAPSAASSANSPPAGSAEHDLGMASGDVEYLLQQAEMALASVNEPVKAAPEVPVKPFRLQDFSGAPPSSEAATLALIREVELDVKIELGRTQMYLDDVLKLHKGSVVALDKLAGDPVDIFVNGRLIARGEVLVLNDNFCVRVAELITGETIP
jgi:flagellar motor switch protein FliN/FliY